MILSLKHLNHPPKRLRHLPGQATFPAMRDGVEVKRCNSCRDPKPWSWFRPSKRGLYGLGTTCERCREAKRLARLARKAQAARAATGGSK